jgi:4-amino-4-deoxy-L-arabinose transferase-like glycosyltransferase
VRAAEYLLSQTKSNLPLVAILAIPLVVMLGVAELWTQEGRFGLICQQMQRSGDYLHPSLLTTPYYGKPLLSYWLMLSLAWVTGSLSELALRLPSAAAGLLSIWCTMRIGQRLFDTATGRIAGAALATSFMFVFWSRVASADMLQVGGMTAAVCWYVEHRERSDWRSYLGFFAILVTASLLKSPAAMVMCGLVIAPDLLRERRWLQHWNVPCLVIGCCAVASFLAPFMLAQMTAVVGQEQASLWTLFRENVTRYFAPFDHNGPVWLYLVQLPVYLLPWSLWLPWLARRTWLHRHSLTKSARWLLWAFALVFAFLTGCGSRRSYYVLPLLPIACLQLAHGWQSLASAQHQRRILISLASIWALLLLWFGVEVPIGNRLHTTRREFAELVRHEASLRADWQQWRVLSFDAVPAASFYLLPAIEAEVVDAEAGEPSAEDRLCNALNSYPHTLIISRRRHLARLQAIMPKAALLEQPPHKFASSNDLLIALVP